MSQVQELIFPPWFLAYLSLFSRDGNIEPIWVNRASGWLQNCPAQPFKQAQIVTMEVNGPLVSMGQVAILTG